MSNPFRDGPVVAPEASAEEPSVFETAPEEVEADEAETDDNYGKFVTDDAPKQRPQDQATVPTARLSKVVRQRNELRETLAEVEARLAAETARAETLDRLTAVQQEHYRNDPDLLDWDARFMAQFDQMAKTNPSLAQAAAMVKAAMSGEAPTMATETPEAEGVEEAPSNPVLDRIVARDVTRTVGDALTEHGVKPHFISLIAADALAVLPQEDLAELTAEDVVEIAKVYVEQNGIPMEEFLVPRKGTPKPSTTGGRGAPARSSAPVEEASERTKPKTVEEWEANRNARFKHLAKDLGF
jgi:hypothetical protein